MDSFVTFILKNETDEERVESELIVNKLNYTFGSDTVEITKHDKEIIVDVKNAIGIVAFNNEELKITRSNENGTERLSVPIKMLKAILRL